MKLHMPLRPEEQHVLLHEAHKLQQNSAGPIRSMDLWMAAQKVLPTHRQRPKFSATLQAKLNKLLRNAKWPEQKPVEAPPVVDDKPPLIITVEKPVKVEPDYGKISTVTLARELLSRLALLEEIEKKFDALADILKARQQVEATYRPNLDVRREIRPVEEKRPARVAIWGPMPDQIAEIERLAQGLPKPLDLRFMRNDTNQQDVPPSVDYVICTRFGRHSQWAKAQEAVGHSRAFFVDSPVKDVVQKLYDIASRQ